MTKEELISLREVFNKSKNIVFLGGAGVSTESGIPDFRSEDGLYNEKYPYPPEVILSHEFFESDPETFFRFYREKMIHTEAKPNPAHYALADLEKEGKLKMIITQNIDGLHQMAGAKSVLELHGSIYMNYCVKCGKLFTLDEMLRRGDVPHCDCGGIIKPDVVLYGEPLKTGILHAASLAISQADTLIIGGTSLVVYPAAALIDYFGGENLILINKGITAYDCAATHVVHDNIGEALSEITKEK